MPALRIQYRRNQSGNRAHKFLLGRRAAASESPLSGGVTGWVIFLNDALIRHYNDEKTACDIKNNVMAKMIIK